MKAVLVFCEGRHDIVFVQRSLGVVGGCEWVGGAIRELPSPFGRSDVGKGLIARRLENRNLEGMALRAAAHLSPPVFEAVLKSDDSGVLFVMLRVHGHQPKAVVELLRDVDAAIGEVGIFDVSAYASAFVFDANDIGLAASLDKFRTSYESHFGDLSGVGHSTWATTDTVPVGSFVFHGDRDNQTGTLEDHLAPMAASAWPGRYVQAQEFVDANRTTCHAVSRNDAARLKAVITATGQFDHPGDPLSEVIGRHGLPSREFENSVAARALVDFLMAVPWSGLRP